MPSIRLPATAKVTRINIPTSGPGVPQPAHEQKTRSTPSANSGRYGEKQTREESDPGVRRQHIGEVSAEHNHDTLGDVDDVHGRRSQRQTGGHQGVDAAGQDSVDDRLKQGGARHRPTPSSWASDTPAGWTPWWCRQGLNEGALLPLEGQRVLGCVLPAGRTSPVPEHYPACAAMQVAGDLQLSRLWVASTGCATTWPTEYASATSALTSDAVPPYLAMYSLTICWLSAF